MRKFTTLIFVGLSTAVSHGQVLLTYNWSTFDAQTELTIPDANATGVSDARTVVGAALQIISLAVRFEASGTYNGDLYLTLQHNSGFSVLLNRPGRSSGNSFGYSDAGLNVTFSDSASNGDVHTYRDIFTPPAASPLTGIWQPDGRLEDPSISLTTSHRSAFLNSFAGKDASGEWTLFAADLSAGGQTQILSWGLDITVVPEPSEFALATSAVLGALALARAHKRRSET